MFGRLRRSKTVSVRQLWQRGSKLIRKGKTAEAKELLLAAASSASPLDRHYAYIKLIHLYRRLAADNPAETDALAAICEDDISLFPDFYEAWLAQYGHSVPPPYFPSFAVLADIYEQQGRLKEAAAVCELALGYGLNETYGEDFPARLDRLLKESQKQ